jgi:hypothetical protein
MTVNSSQKHSVQLKCLQLCITNSMQCQQFLSFSRVHTAYNSATNINNKFIDKVHSYQELKENPVAELFVFAYHGTLRNEM